MRLRRGRVSIRILMALVAIAGLALAAAIMAGRSAEFRARADHDAEFEALSHA